MTDYKVSEFYKRTLELMAVIGEEWGEAVKEINDYNWKGCQHEHLKKAINEIAQIYNPLRELKARLIREHDLLTKGKAEPLEFYLPY